MITTYITRLIAWSTIIKNDWFAINQSLPSQNLILFSMIDQFENTSNEYCTSSSTLEFEALSANLVIATCRKATSTRLRVVTLGGPGRLIDSKTRDEDFENQKTERLNFTNERWLISQQRLIHQHLVSQDPVHQHLVHHQPAHQSDQIFGWFFCQEAFSPHFPDLGWAFLKDYLIIFY